MKRILVGVVMLTIISVLVFGAGQAEAKKERDAEILEMLTSPVDGGEVAIIVFINNKGQMDLKLNKVGPVQASTMLRELSNHIEKKALKEEIVKLVVRDIEEIQRSMVKQGSDKAEAAIAGEVKPQINTEK